MIIVGLTPTAHESAAAVVIDGKLVAAAAEERFTRVKNQGGFPTQALDWCMKNAGVRPSDVDHVAYAALPFQKERLRDVVGYGRNLAYVALGSDAFARKAAHLLNYTKNLVFQSDWRGVERKIAGALQQYGLDQKLVFVDHHRAHCAAAYYCSGFEDCLVVSLDGYGSGQAGSFYRGKNGKLELLSPIPYPHSLGTFYRRVTQALGFKPNRHEGKIVGLAAFGDPSRLYDVVRARFDLEHEDYYRYKSGHDPFFEARLAEKYPREDIAAAYQRVLEDVATHYIAKWVQRTGARKIACAGGVFANVKMNQRVMELSSVEEVFVFPAMGDGGVGAGAAFALAADLVGLVPRRIPNVYLGPSYDSQEIERALARSGLPYRRPNELAKEVAAHLVADRVVAHFDGPMEFGPRALGNRSILYPARDPNVNKWLNDRLKRTEFMPFAPITMAEHAASRYANLDRMVYTAEFMTMTTNCSAQMKAESPAAVHVDGTARPQLVSAETNDRVYSILREYNRESGIPTLINTSFNMHEEPIVCSPDDAIRAFKDGALEILVLGDFLVEHRPPAQA